MEVRDATVGPLFGHLPGIGLHDFDRVEIKAERFGGNLRKDRVGSLTNLSARGEYSYLYLRRLLQRQRLIADRLRLNR